MTSKLLGFFYQNSLNYREYKRDGRGRFAKKSSATVAEPKPNNSKLSHISDVKGISSKIAEWAPHHKKMEEIIQDTELKDSLDSLQKFKTESEVATKRGHEHLTLPPGINLSEFQKKENKEHHDKNLKINVEPTDVAKFYRINNGKLGGFITEKDGVHHVSIKHMYGMGGTIPFKSADEADKYLKNTIQNFAESRVIPTSKKDEIIQHNLKKIESLKDKNKDNPYNNTDKEILHDNIGIADEIKSLLKSNSNAIATIDEHGNIQAAAKYKGRGNHIYVDFLATAPWNLAESHENKVRGAGAKTLAHLAQKSIDKGYKGKLKLTPLEKAKGFYKHLGFVEDENEKMHLSPEAAKKLIEKYGGD